jgi:glycine hydroxymethyltransferase
MCIATESDPVFAAIDRELRRQRDQIELIASENIVSEAVLAAQGSVLTNKYAEGYVGRRYYGGCEFVDEIEQLAIDRAKQIFGVKFANVQPHSGAQANGAVFLALLNPGDTFLSMSLAHGGHLTHGAPVSVSGKWFKPFHYSVRQADQLIDMDEVRTIARIRQPKIILAGGSSYSRIIDFAAFRAIADEVGALLMVDMAHIAGLVAAGVYPSPLPHAHVVTTTTHKTLRGPRGGMILTNDQDLAKKLNSAVFPGLQGGPLMHIIAAKAVALGEACLPQFKDYCANVLSNGRELAETLIREGMTIVSGGTDCHMMLVDLRSTGLTGQAAEVGLERVGLTCNKNGIPFDLAPPTITSGIRLGTAAGTTRGFGRQEFREIGCLISAVLKGMGAEGPTANSETHERVRAKVRQLCAQFPIYPNLKG